jgi:hypothetical protein
LLQFIHNKLAGGYFYLIIQKSASRR